MATPEMKAGDRDTLQRAAGHGEHAKGDFDRLSADLSSQIVSYQSSKWSGQGGSAFQTLQPGVDREAEPDRPRPRRLREPR